MKTLALHEMGEVIRKVRKERGLRLEDLADENISPATVSNIERGVAHVSPEKVTYLLEKLELPMSKLPEMLVQEQVELKKVKFALLTISTLRQIGYVEDALTKLEELKLDDSHPYIAHAYFYKGECYVAKKKWKQAERSFYNALRSAQQNSFQENNMEAASYLLLGICSDHQGNLDQALEYVNDGLLAFYEGGEMQHVKHLLHKHKGIMLQKLGRVTEAMQLVQDSWHLLTEVDDIETTLGFYWLRSELSRRTGLIEEAIEYAVEGIDVARRNKQYSAMFDLWIVLGTIYTAQKDWEMAETSFLMARKLEEKIPIDQRWVTVYSRTGVLYLKQGKLSEAFEYFQHAIRYANKFQDAPQLVSNLVLTGELCQLMNDTNKAIHFFEQGIEIAQKYSYSDMEWKIWYNLAGCFNGQDEEKFQHCMRKTYEIKENLLDKPTDLGLAN
jgi:tetratricopeptide (TPR) repeat protein